MLRIGAYTGGIRVPSARLRIRQYLKPLRRLGIHVDEYVSPAGTYPPENRMLRPGWAACSLLLRVPQIVRSHNYDLTLLQREILSTFATLEPLTRRPRVLDVDDAIWIYRRGRFAERIAGLCQGVICGNSFLAEWFSRFNPAVVILPTAVDTRRYKPVRAASLDSSVIGWSGSRSNLRYLEDLEGVLASVLHRHRHARLRIVCDVRPRLGSLPASQIEFVRWTPEAEVAALQTMTVGLMPLRDSTWCRGKCSYKMLTYMACGLPVVVSPVGMNQQLLSQARCGYGAVKPADWADTIEAFLENPGLAAAAGAAGRSLVEQEYSLEVLAPRLAELLRHFAGVRTPYQQTVTARHACQPAGSVPGAQ